MAMWLVQMGTLNYGVTPGEKAKASPCSSFYRQGFQLDDIHAVITLHMPSTRNLAMMHLTLHPRQLEPGAERLRDFLPLHMGPLNQM